MKLLLPTIMAGLLPIAHDKNHAEHDHVKSLLTKLHRAEKFIFDSGMDSDEETTSAVRETAVNMVEAGIFHLPFPEIWIEDPFEMPVGGQNESRYMYFCEEYDAKIFVWFFADPNGNIFRLPLPLQIDLTAPEDAFGYPEDNPHAPAFYKIAGEAIYAVKKFVVTLATRGTEKSTVRGGNHTLNMKARARRYPHTVVRIPSAENRGDSYHKLHGPPRRLHLVRGFVWGKNTRPIKEQRWIAPYWRGLEELGEIERDHYHVEKKIGK